MSGRPRRPSGSYRLQDHDRLHPTAPADRTCRDIATGETLDHSFDSFPGRDVGLGLSQQDPAARQLDLAVAIGKQAIVANAHKAGRQNVQEKASDEFSGHCQVVFQRSAG